MQTIYRSNLTALPYFKYSLDWQEMLESLASGRESPSEFNEHWRPVEDLCHPCTLGYRYVVRFETLLYDSERVLRNIQLSQIGRGKVRTGVGEKGRRNKLLSFPSVKVSKTRSLIPEYFGGLNSTLVKVIRDLYQSDIDMFEYPNR